MKKPKKLIYNKLQELTELNKSHVRRCLDKPKKVADC